MSTQPSPPRDGSVFDRVAAEYDRRRPAYPDELIDDACRIAGIGSGERVLEIGCGSGQLTVALVARGLEVTAVEPGRRLMALAEENLAGRGRVEFVNSSFEDAVIADSRFRAVFSASAFHWVDPDVGWEKAARVLVPGGTLALIQYCGLLEERSREDQEALLRGLARVAPEAAANWPVYRDLEAMVTGVRQRGGNVSEAWAWMASQDVARAQASLLFDDVRIAVVPVLMEQTAHEVTALLATASFYQRLSAPQRQALEDDYAALAQRLGRPIRSSTAAVLVTARRGASTARRHVPRAHG